ncbi:SDR family oxidoreductase [Humibacter ginsenosidimutans]|uniref:SDR family oxidoreductase n=1 Tax=Humibacter ginsenosidimutans TaxID=2599293 RepID=UPI00349E5CCE
MATRLASEGASVFVQHHAAHDADQPWGSDDLDAVRAGILERLAPHARFGDLGADLAQPDAPAQVIDAARAAIGRLDILVCNHARSGGDGSIFDMTADRLSGHFDVNARSTLLLTRHFADQFSGVDVRDDADASRPGDVETTSGPFDEFATGRVIWMTSGQLLGPMRGEVAYAASKAALASVTPTVAAELLGRGILLNTVNPGPVNTGYLDADTSDRAPETVAEVLASMPFGRFGQPDDVARLIAWLVSSEGRWTTGQVLTSDGGFSLT